MTKVKELTTTNRYELVKLIHEGYSYREIARMYNISHNTSVSHDTIGKACKRLGLTSKISYRSKNPKRDEHIKSLYTYLTLKQIGVKYNLTKQRIQQIVTL